MDALDKAISKLNLKLPEGFRIEASKTEHIPGKMFIGGLSRNTSKEALFNYLSQYGDIIDFTIKTHPETGVSRGFGFVLFEDNEAVEKVLHVKEHQVEGRIFELRKAQAMELKFPPRKVFVGGVNPKTSEDKIRQYFGTFGAIEHIEMPVCPKTNGRRSFCFITYNDEVPVRKLLETRYHLLGYRRCEVKIAVENEIPKMSLRGRDIPFSKLDNALGGEEPPTGPNAPRAGGINPSGGWTCGVDPNAHRAISVHPIARGVMSVHPNSCGAITVNPNVYGAVAVHPNVYEACRVNPSVYRVSGDVGNPTTVLAPVHISPCNHGFNYSDQAYGSFYNVSSNQPIFNSYGSGQHFVGCDYGTQPMGTALANYTVQLNQAPYCLPYWLPGTLPAFLRTKDEARIAETT